MNPETKEKIMIAIVYLYTHGIKINKKRISAYTGFSWPTVHKYLDEIFPEYFLLDDIAKYNDLYISEKTMKGGK